MWLRGREVGRFEPLEPTTPEPSPLPDLGTLGSRPDPDAFLQERVVPADFEGSADDHKFQAPEGKPWGLCAVCNLGQAAHLVSDPYVSDAPRAPEGAVRTGQDDDTGEAA